MMTKSVMAITLIALCATILLSTKALAFNPLTDTGACPPNSPASTCQDNAQSQGQTTSDNKIYGPNGLLTKAANIISVLIGVVAVIMIIIAGLQLVTSSGDAARLTTARNTIIYAVVGLVVAAFAQAIIIFVLRKL